MNMKNADNFGTSSSENFTGTLTMKMQLKPFPIQMGWRCDVDVYAL